MPSSWTTGTDIIAKLVTSGALQQISGGDADGHYLLDEAARRLDGAIAVREVDPVSSYELAYESARHSATALLVQQGLRPRSQGGHIAIVSAVCAQFGEDNYASLDALRRVRNQIEYPRRVDDVKLTGDEIDLAHDVARSSHEHATALIEHLGLWHP